MGLIAAIVEAVFGGGRNVIRETAEVFRENAESGAARGADARAQAMQQFGAEFAGQRRSRFDAIMDGINRLPRPMMALGCIGLFIAAMVAPVWFAERMQGIALVPEPLWWLLGVIVSFYFGARYQAKGQAFQRDIARSLSRAPQVVESIEDLRGLRTPDSRVGAQDETGADANPALRDWGRDRGAQR
ncbi:Holin of 3TMs, for gene-transfer release [Salinihabitans flavidus]|uniref:Holin of 3TMs, for gene-transfer release n=1 Tax=Salinihabitans flavidus TaxID=569882 RepID=A0A1H8TWP3_9RHOB|nr:holin family protein [Salinihabitans flavidus]SEO95442.1 Holin of 3TMs, for gene-transfer release [Salinihabitans flavidus]